MKKLIYSVRFARKIFKHLFEISFKDLFFEIFADTGLTLLFERRLEVNTTNTPLRMVIRILKQEKPSKNSIVIVCDEHKKYLFKKFPSLNIFSSSEINSLNPLDYSKIFWLTDQYDKNIRFLRIAYKNKIPVQSCAGIVPSRSWNFIPEMRRTIKSESMIQKEEGIFKFCSGYGLDASILMQIVTQLESVSGDYVEIGCFMGSSGCIQLRQLSTLNSSKKFYFYDTFDGFNYDEAFQSGDYYFKNTHKTDGRDKVHQRFLKRYQNVTTIKRNICEEDPLREIQKIAFANIDVDLYEAVCSALEAVDKKLVDNGIIIVEDPGHAPFLSGALAAMYEFIEKMPNKYTVIHLVSGQAMLIKRMIKEV